MEPQSTDAPTADETKVEGTEPEAKADEAKTEATFTQADVDRIVSERLAREARKTADYEDLKTKAAAYDDLKARGETDVQEAVEAARKDVEARLRAEFATERVADKIEALAAGKFADVEDARLRLQARVEEFVTDGSVDTEAISKALDEVLEKHPHLAAKAVETPGPGRAGIGVTGNGKTESQAAPGYDRLRGAYAAGA